MTHPVRVPKHALQIPPARHLNAHDNEETWAWIVSQGFRWYIADDSPLWFADGYMYAHRLAIRYPDQGRTGRIRAYELSPDRASIHTRLVGYPVRGLPPILNAQETN